MKQWWGIGQLVGICLLLPGLVLGEGVPTEPAGSVTWEGLLEEAQARSPEVQAAEAEWEAARARVPQAWALPNPWLSYDVMGSDLETRLGPQEQRVGIFQGIPFPGKFSLRDRAAVLSARQAQHRLLHVRQAVRSQVTAAAARMVTARRVMELLQEERKILEQLGASIRAQIPSGQRTVSDALALEGLFTELAQRESRVSEQAVAARETLQALAGVVLPAGVRIAEPLLPRLEPEGEPERVLETAQAHRHALIISRLAGEERTVERRLAQMERWPDMEVGFLYTQIGDGSTTHPEDGRDAWMIPLRFSLPLWEPQISGRIREARASEEAARHRTEQEIRQVRSEVVSRWTEYQAALRRVDLDRESWIPQAASDRESAQAGYAAGTVDIQRLLESERMLLEAWVRCWGNTAEALIGFARLEEAVGVPLTGRDPFGMEMDHLEEGDGHAMD